MDSNKAPLHCGALFFEKEMVTKSPSAFGGWGFKLSTGWSLAEKNEKGVK